MPAELRSTELEAASGTDGGGGGGGNAMSLSSTAASASKTPSCELRDDILCTEFEEDNNDHR
jgi:hypothetical protein